MTASKVRMYGCNLPTAHHRLKAWQAGDVHVRRRSNIGTANALVLDFLGDSDLVMIAPVEWARANQPDLVTNANARSSGITFEVK